MTPPRSQNLLPQKTGLRSHSPNPKAPSHRIRWLEDINVGRCSDCSETPAAGIALQASQKGKAPPAPPPWEPIAVFLFLLGGLREHRVLTLCASEMLPNKLPRPLTTWWAVQEHWLASSASPYPSSGPQCVSPRATRMEGAWWWAGTLPRPAPRPHHSLCL